MTHVEVECGSVTHCETRLALGDYYFLMPWLLINTTRMKFNKAFIL